MTCFWKQLEASGFSVVEKVHDLISNLKTMIILPWNFDILSRRWALKLIFLYFLLFCEATASGVFVNGFFGSNM